jgi:hypothetical protein
MFLAPNTSPSLQTAFAANAHPLKEQLYMRSRHWKKQSLWYTQQELEDQRFPKEKDRIENEGNPPPFFRFIISAIKITIFYKPLQ